MPRRTDRFDDEQEASAISYGVEAGIFCKCHQCGDAYIIEPDSGNIRNLVVESLHVDEDDGQDYEEELNRSGFNSLSELLFVIQTLHGRLKQKHRC